MKKRKELLEAFTQEPLDLLVIGGGITGAGVALDAQVRGLKTGLIEMRDFASGTSSRSTKLVYGGLQFFKQMDVKHVSEVSKERAIVYENAPHVIRPEWMLLPFYKDGPFSRLTTSLGLKVYERFAAVKKNERRHMLTKKQAIQAEPLLSADRLKGAGLYVEYRTDDARLTIETIKEAVRRGTKALNYLKVESYLYEEGQAVGVVAVNQLTGEALKIYARKIVNATGPWLDRLREQDRSKK